MRWALLIVALCLPVTGAASVIERGAVEITAAGSFNHQTFEEVDGHITSLRAQVGVLPALGDKVQLGGRLGLNHQSLDLGGLGETDGGTLQADLILRVNLGRSTRVVPYLELGGGVLVWAGDLETETNTITFPQLAVGARMLVHEIASFNLSFGWVNEKNSLGLKDFDSDVVLVQLGFSVFPKGLDGTR